MPELSHPSVSATLLRERYDHVGFFDEMFDAAGTVRPFYEPLHAQLSLLTTDALAW